MSTTSQEDSPRLAFVVLNVIGGVAVLASYVLWLGNPSNDGGALWGAIGSAGRALYTISMVAAAAGYFAFAPYLLRGDPARLPFARVNLLFALILFPSALWMPLAFEYLDAPSHALWWAMRLDLLVTGLASAGLAWTLWRTSPPSRARTLACAGSLAFTFQTLVLDALVWPLFFAAGS